MIKFVKGDGLLIIETKAIKFYLNTDEKIMEFFKECQQVENELLKYYWINFNDVIVSNSWFEFYKIRIMITEPKTKFNHYQQILHMVYCQLKSIQSNIIKKIKFKFEDKEKQKIYNYCKGFCFDWHKLFSYTKKQMKTYKNEDNSYYEFLLKVNNFINNDNNFNTMKEEIENEFYEIKSKQNIPIKKEFQIWVNTFHTVDIIKEDNKWTFIIDNNHAINKKKFEKMIIPIKLSDYHKNILNKHELKNTFTLKLNQYNKIEIIGVYEENINYPETNLKDKDIVGIDIGLKKLITCSDGEIIEQNKTIVKKVKALVKHQSNRNSLEAHLQKKYNDENFKLSDKNYLKRQRKLTRFVLCDNRKKIKQFLKGRENEHIIIEDLKLSDSKTYSKVVNNLLKRLHMQRIKEYMIKYCKKKGIEINKVNPMYTSQQCSKCNYTSKENRKTQSEFNCIKCGHKDNADHNASENIKNRYFNKEIKLKTPIWKVKQILNVV